MRQLNGESNLTTLPFYEGANLSLPKFAEFLGASKVQMANITERSPRTVYRDFASNEVFVKLKPLIYGIKILLTIANPIEIKKWLHEPLVEWKGRSPMDELERGNIKGVVNLIERVAAGEGGY